jgi:uncharacterized protein (TIGR00369 family)
MSSSVPDRDALGRFAHQFFERIPHGRKLGLELVEFAPRSLVVKLPYRPEIVGNPYTGYIHSGALTVLVDQTCGAAAMLSLAGLESVATLDLRIDHLRAAKPGVAVYAHAECYRLAREVAFVRCVCYEEDPADLIATSMSTFMRTGGRRTAAGGEARR